MEKLFVVLLQAIFLAGSLVTPNPEEVLEMDKEEAEDLAARGVVRILSEEEVAELDMEDTEQNPDKTLAQLIADGVDGLSQETADRMVAETGLETMEAIAAADPKVLVKVQGIGDKLAAKIQDFAKTQAGE